MLKCPNGKRAVTPPNQSITFSPKTLTRNLKIATAFAKQFTSIRIVAQKIEKKYAKFNRPKGIFILMILSKSLRIFKTLKIIYPIKYHS